MPTTPGQSIVVFALTVLLMCNTTVLLLVLTGELRVGPVNEPALASLPGEPEPRPMVKPVHHQATAISDQTEPEQPEAPRRPSAVTRHEQAAAPPGPANKPRPITQPASRAARSEPVEPVQQIEPVERIAADLPSEPTEPDGQPEAEPEQADPPTTFFGIQLD